MICVNDIVNDLGVTKLTVWRWIGDGKIKGHMKNRRTGWLIEEADYQAFLDKHPKWRLVRDGDVYKSSEIKAREDALLRVSAQIISSKLRVSTEKRNKQYMDGFERAIIDIQAAINREMERKTPA